MWCLQGFILWWERMRRTVSGEMLSTMPSSMSFLASSVQSHCERDLPADWGLSQAIFTRWIATSGGEKRGSAPARFVIETMEPLFPKPFGPLVDGATGHPDGLSDPGDGCSIREHEDDPGPSCLTMIDGCGSLPLLKGLPLFRGEKYCQMGFPSLGHGSAPF